ncbi:MAG TPA: hypothetical protein VNZ53_19340 [Steroidobacteraceae bacterium]|jgi:hypothetical protein|nr:hypothetical protein [Steroidobacteraceae bacterium]
MTIYGSNGGVVTGQPISPSFGAQNGANGGTAVLQLPTTMPILEAMSRGILPRNLYLGSVNGVSVGPNNPTALDDIMSNGAGNQVNAGVAVPNIAANPAGNGAINNEIFVSGGSLGGANAGLTNGPVPVNTETLTSCPVSGATLASTLAPFGTAGQPVFAG